MEQSDAPEKNSGSRSTEVAYSREVCSQSGHEEQNVHGRVYTTAQDCRAVAGAPGREHWCTVCFKDYCVHY